MLESVATFARESRLGQDTNSQRRRLSRGAEASLGLRAWCQMGDSLERCALRRGGRRVVGCLGRTEGLVSHGTGRVREEERIQLGEVYMQGNGSGSFAQGKQGRTDTNPVRPRRQRSRSRGCSSLAAPWCSSVQGRSLVWDGSRQMRAVVGNVGVQGREYKGTDSRLTDYRLPEGAGGTGERQAIAPYYTCDHRTGSLIAECVDFALPA